MANTRDTGYLRNLIAYDGSGNITLPANLTVTGSLLANGGGSYATQSYVSTQISNLVNGAPGLLDTLDELAAALGDDANFAATLTTSLAGKQASLSGTGFVKISGTTISYDTSVYLTTASATNTYLPLAGGTLTGPLLGTASTFSGIITANSQTTATNGSINIENLDPAIRFKVTSGSANKRIYEWRAVAAGGVNDIMQLRLWNDAQSSAATLFSVTSAGAGTFLTSVNATNFVSNITNGYGLLLNRPATTNYNGISYQTANAGQWFVGMRENGTNNYIIYNENGTDALIISKANSNVGVRTATPYSPLTVTGAGIAWGETVTYYPSAAGYITLAFRLEGADSITGTWAFGKESSTGGNTSTQFLQVIKNGLTGSALHRVDAVQTWDPANGNSYFGYSVGIGTTVFPSADYKFVVRQGADRNLAIASQASEMSIEAYNNAATSSVPLRFYSSKFSFLNGGVGIGTSTVGSYVLALDYNASLVAVMSIKNSSVNGYSGAHIMNNAGTVMGHWGYANGSTAAPLTDTVYFGSTASKSVVFTTADTIRMTITANGQVLRHNQPSFLAYSDNGGFTVTGGSWYNISNALTVESYDITSNYSSGRFTAPVAGRYLFYAGGWASISSNGERYAWSAVVNGSGLTFIGGGNYCLTDSPLAGYQIVYNLAAGDYVELQVFSAVSGTWGAGTHRVYWGGYLL